MARRNQSLKRFRISISFKRKVLRNIMEATKWNIGISNHNFSRETFEAYAQAGIDCMEISIGRLPAEIEWKEIQKNANATGVKLWSYHLPFCPFEQIDISSESRQMREYTVDLFAERIRRAGDAGVKYAVIHPSGEPVDAKNRKERLKYSGESLSSLADVAQESGLTIAVEDLPRTCLGNCISDMETITSCDDRLRICLDTNHLLTEKNVDFIKALGKKIVTLHVSDYDFLNERHWLPYEGKNDWIAIVTALEDAGYRGAWMYEVGFEPAKSIERRRLTCEDFMENYLCCVNKRPAPVLGRPSDRLMDHIYYSTPQIQ